MKLHCFERRAFVCFSAIFLCLQCLPWQLTAFEQFPLGILGGRGEVTAGSNLLKLVALHEKSPAAEAGLQTGDRISGIDGVTFKPHSNNIDDGGSGPQRALGEALDDVASRKQDDQRTILLNVVRGEGEQELVIRCLLPHRAGVLDQKGRAQLLERAAQHLRKTQRPAGHWDAPVGLTGDRVLTAWAAIALKSLDEQQDEERLKKSAAWLLGPNDRAWIPEELTKKGPDNLGNWALTATAIALVECSNAKPDAKQKVALELICQALQERMDDGGRFGHDVITGYSGKGFNVINTLTHLAWTMGEQVEVSIDKAKWKLSFDQINQSVDSNGGIRYWTLKNTGTGDASLRTSSMALALAISKRNSELVATLSNYLDKHRSRTREAHAVGSMGMLLTPAALWRHDREAYHRFLNEWRWYLSLMQDNQGTLHYIGGKRNNGGDSYLGMDRMACAIAIMILSPPDEKLVLYKN